jgi:prophage regulatory protein
MPHDILDLLRLDPGSRTLGQLLQECEWAYGEITRLRRVHARNHQNRPYDRTAETLTSPPIHFNTDATLDTHRLLRLPEVFRMTGVPRSSIYKRVADGHFPALLKISKRSVRWRFADVLA